MVYPGTLFYRRQRSIPMHSYENGSQIRALEVTVRPSSTGMAASPLGLRAADGAGGQAGRVGLYPIVALQYISTTLYQVSYHNQ
jgi:hypothetical protein